MPPLLHFSEDPAIPAFVPHIPATANPEDRAPMVWAVDEAHAPAYWFPRSCPRACCWRDTAPPTDAGRALLGAGTRMHAIEDAWLERVRTAALYVYRFDPAPFALYNADAGYYAARQTVVPLSVEPAGGLLARHAAAGIALRVVPNLWPVIDAIVASGLGFSIIRKANASPRASSSAA